MAAARKSGSAQRPGKRSQTGGLRFFFDDHFELRGDAVDQLHGDQRFAENLDGLIERDAALVDLEALRLKRFGKISGGDRAEQLVGLAGLARELDGHVS